jgi:hypothetical protein
METPSKWHGLIPWYITIISTLSLILVAFYLYRNIEWFKNSSMDDPELQTNAAYRIFIYSSHLSMLKRSLGIITGIAITFIGLGVSFYALEKTADVEISGFAKLTAFSPGLFAILFGCFLISQAISSKDTMQFAAPGPDSKAQSGRNTPPPDTETDSDGATSAFLRADSSVTKFDSTKKK